MNDLPKGMWPVLYAFFDAMNRVDHSATRRQIDMTIDAGAPAIVTLGLATEVHRLSGDEKRAMIDACAEHIDGRVPLAVTITGDTVDAQVALASHALERGASWLILQPPSTRGEPETYYYDFFSAVLERTNAPSGIQNAPDYRGVGLSAESIAALAAERSGFRLLKGEGPAVTIRAVIEKMRALGQSLSVFNGRGGQESIDNLRAGCDGLIVAPELYDHQRAIFDAFARGDEQTAEARYAAILPAIVFVMQSLETLTCYGKRIAAWRMGFDVEHDRGAQPSAFGIECARRFASVPPIAA